MAVDASRMSIGLKCWARRRCIGRTLRRGHRCRRGTRRRRRTALRALGEGRSHAAVSLGEARERGRVVFVFPGQGSQWTSMGRALLAESSVFAETVAACEAALRRHTDWSLTAVLRGDEGAGVPSLERVDVIQPALFAMNVALAAVWRSLGLEPAAVVGHSQGEIAAARGRWHFITGRGRSSRGVAQPAAEAGERQRRDGGDGACGRGRGRAAAGARSGRVCRWR